MRILDVQERWIHTHYILDRGELNDDECAVVKSVASPVLRRNSIQVGYHIVEQPGKGVT